MKLLRLTIPLVLALLSVSTALAQESSVDSGVEWQTLEEAQKKAKETGKKVLVFGYADWCTYCMKMRKETYPEENVQKSLSDDFIPVQINGESEEEIVFNEMTPFIHSRIKCSHYFSIRFGWDHHFHFTFIEFLDEPICIKCFIR